MPEKESTKNYFREIRQMKKERLKLTRAIPTLRQLEVELLSDVMNLLDSMHKEELCFPEGEIYDYLCAEKLTRRFRKLARGEGIRVLRRGRQAESRYGTPYGIRMKMICFRRIEDE